MSILGVTASFEYTNYIVPSLLLVNTNDTFATVQTIGYLNGQTINPCGVFIPVNPFSNNQLALVTTTDYGQVLMNITIDGSSNVNLNPIFMPFKKIVTSPPASSTSSLSLGTSYQNTLGYDAMLTVYLNITSALTASILLGVGPTSTPTQQTLVSGLTLAALSVIPVNIYMPAGYYAKLSTSGTIAIAISGQIAMPI